MISNSLVDSSSLCMAFTINKLDASIILLAFIYKKPRRQVTLEGTTLGRKVLAELAEPAEPVNL